MNQACPITSPASRAARFTQMKCGQEMGDQATLRTIMPFLRVYPCSSVVQHLPSPCGLSNLEVARFRAGGRRGGRVADRGGLLSRCRGHTLPRVRIPPSPLFFFQPFFSTLPIQYRCESVRRIKSSPATAGDAEMRSPSLFVCSNLNSGPARTTKVVPSLSLR